MKHVKQMKPIFSHFAVSPETFFYSLLKKLNPMILAAGTLHSPLNQRVQIPLIHPHIKNPHIRTSPHKLFSISL